MPADPPTLMAISDFGAENSPHSSSSEQAQWIDALAAAGIDAVQVRAKTLRDRELELLVRKVVDLAAGRLLVLVNGRADIAIAAGADGVHLPADGVPPRALGRRFDSLVVGLSTHHRHEIVAAQGHVDYVTFGPVFNTPSKAAYGPPCGLDELKKAAFLGVPLLALGGVSASALPSIAATGTSGAAAIRALQDRESLVKMGAEAARLWP